MKYLTEILYHGLIITTLYLGFYVGIEWAKNIALFAMWATVAASFLVLSVSRKNEDDKKSIKFTSLLSLSAYIGYMIVSAAYGYFWLAGCQLVSFFIILAMAQDVLIVKGKK